MHRGRLNTRPLFDHVAQSNNCNHVAQSNRLVRWVERGEIQIFNFKNQNYSGIIITQKSIRHDFTLRYSKIKDSTPIWTPSQASFSSHQVPHRTTCLVGYQAPYMATCLVGHRAPQGRTRQECLKCALDTSASKVHSA